MLHLSEGTPKYAEKYGRLFDVRVPSELDMKSADLRASSFISQMSQKTL